jgi:hypothetical protein
MTLLSSTSSFTPIEFVVGPSGVSGEPRLVRSSGAVLLHAPTVTPTAVNAALKSLQELNVAGRRIVWCNAAELVGARHGDRRGWGRKFVEAGGADMAVLCGVGGRDLAVAARDAGLPLTRVVVCREDSTARNVLSDSVQPGDAILALGVSEESCRAFAERLDSRFEIAA